MGSPNSDNNFFRLFLLYRGSGRTDANHHVQYLKGHTRMNPIWRFRLFVHLPKALCFLNILLCIARYHTYDHTYR